MSKRVFVNDNFIDTFRAHDNEQKQILIPESSFNKENGNDLIVLSLRLELPDAISPYSLGEGNDRRLLGLAIKNITLKQIDR